MALERQLENVSAALPEHQTDLASKVQSTHGRVYFDVPFDQKERGKVVGLRWDNIVRKWYAPTAEIAEAFAASSKDVAPTRAPTERFYFNVPFLQKDRAKALGMRFDGARKLWFAPSSALAVDAARFFERIVEQSGDRGRYSTK